MVNDLTVSVIHVKHDMTVSAIYQEGKMRPYKVMTAQTIAEIRRTNLKALSFKHGGRDGLAQRIGRDRNQIDQLMTKKNMGSKLSRDVEKALKLPTGWMDSLHPALFDGQSFGADEDVPPLYSRAENKQNIALFNAWQRLDEDIRVHLVAIIEILAEKEIKK